MIYTVRKSTPRFKKSPSVVLIRLVLSEIQRFKNVKISKEMYGFRTLYSKCNNLNLISRFKTEAMRISQLMKDSPRTPLEKTGDWVEYVLRHGGARHLRAQVFNIPWYQYYLLDVIAFLVAVVTLVVIAIRLACRCMCCVCCRRSSNKTKRE